MTERTRDLSSTTNSSHLPLEVLLSISIPVLATSVAMAVFIYHLCKKKDSRTGILATSPSLLMLSDPEANRRWLDDLMSMRYLGLSKLNRKRRACSFGLDVKCRGEGPVDDSDRLIGLPTHPLSAFCPARRDTSSHCATIRRSWIQSIFHSGYDTCVNRVAANRRGCMQPLPEIRVTVPSMVIDGETPIFPQDRRWSGIIAHDIGVANDDSQNYADPGKYHRVCDAPVVRHERNSRYYPPNSMVTLPSPARRRILSPFDIAARPDNHVQPMLRPLSPIMESRESLATTSCSFFELDTAISETAVRDATLGSETPMNQGTLMSSYGLALLRSCSSLQSTSTSSSSYHDEPLSQTDITKNCLPETISDLSGPGRSHLKPVQVPPSPFANNSGCI